MSRARTNIEVEDLVLAHSSDIHLGGDSSNAAEASDAALNSLARVMHVARSAGARVLLLAGDTFEHNRQQPAYVDRAVALMEQSGLAVVILPGNHDPLTDDSVYRQRGFANLDNVSVLGLGGGEALYLPGLDLEVWGRPHVHYGDMQPLAEPGERRLRWRVVMAHGHLDETELSLQRFRAAWLFQADRLAATGADYVALGHWNRHFRVSASAPPAYYSGSPDFAGSINLVTFQPNGHIAVERLALDQAAGSNSWPTPLEPARP